MKWPLGIATLPISIGAPGITLNTLILIVYLRGWYKGKRPTAQDLILFAMTFTDIFFQCTQIADGLIFYVHSHKIIPTELYLYDFFMFFFLINTCFWQTALLSTYYCVKLLNFSHSFFQRVKTMISTSTNLLLLASAVFCFLISLPLIWTIHVDLPENVTESMTGNDLIFSFNNLFNHINLVFGCGLPFIVTFTCITLSVGFLLKHAWSIRKNSLQLSSSPQIGGLVRAACTMVLCAVLDLISCVDVFGQVYFQFNCGDIVDTINWIILTLYPVTRPIVLIIGNPQLKKQLGKMCASS